MQVSDDAATSIPLVLPIERGSTGTCECLIRGKAQRGVLVRLLAIFESRGIAVLNCSYESEGSQGTFRATLVLQLENDSDSETLTLVEKLMETKIVSSIEFAPLKEKAFGNFRFPIILLPGKRGVVIQPTSLAKGLQETSHFSDSDLQQAGLAYGKTFAGQALTVKRSGRAEEIVLQVLRATGWGTGKLEEKEKGEISFVLKDPAIGIESEGDGASKFLLGMIQGMLEEIYASPLRLLQDRFDGKTNSLVLRLTK